LKFGAALNSRLSTWLLIIGAKDLIRAYVRAKGGHFEHCHDFVNFLSHSLCHVLFKFGIAE